MTASDTGQELKQGQATPAQKSYDPAYDPMLDATPGVGTDYAPTYWIGTAGAPPEDDGPITHDIEVDVAIIGAGFTGLTTAIYLAQEHGIKATVLEANRTAWGCSTRNGEIGRASCRERGESWVGGGSWKKRIERTGGAEDA